MTTLAELPSEILVHLFSFLRVEDLATIAKVCRKFYEASRVEFVWQKRCFEDFGITGECGQHSYYDVYSKLLHEYGHCLGLWRQGKSPYGGLLNVKLENGEILIATAYHAPIDPRITDKLRQKRLFTVQMADGNQAVMKCHKGHGAPHSARIELVVEDEDTFALNCLSKDMHRLHSGSSTPSAREYVAWAQEESGTDGENNALLINKFMHLFQNEAMSVYHRFEMPSVTYPGLIKPGLFKGHYGGHGVEIIRFSYEENHKAQGLKITGDPNVFAGELSLKVDLRRPMILTYDQQERISIMEEIDTPDLPGDVAIDKLPQQPFRLPFDSFERDITPPRHCRARFHGHGQIAGHGFRNAEFVPAHWIVFDDNTFGVLWLKLRSLSMFSRVHEHF